MKRHLWSSFSTGWVTCHTSHPGRVRRISLIFYLIITKDHAYCTSDDTETASINCAIKPSETQLGTPSPLFSHLCEITRLNGNCHMSVPSRQETQRTMTSFLFGSRESRELPFCRKCSIRKQPPGQEKPWGGQREGRERSEINSGFLTQRESSRRCTRRRVKSINFKLCYPKGGCCNFW